MSELEAMLKGAQEQVAIANQLTDVANKRAAALLEENHRLRTLLLAREGRHPGTYAPAPDYGPGKPA